jgi:hypothetical protein
VLIVPVRHHSPAAALQVGRLIRKRRPRVVLIEGPADATDLIDRVLDTGTVPPVALYAYRRRGDDVRASFYPFCAYSPEYVALQAGREVGAELLFCDLPASATLEWGDLTGLPSLDAGEEETGGSDRDSDPVAGDDDEVGYGAFTTALAEAASRRSGRRRSSRRPVASRPTVTSS